MHHNKEATRFARLFGSPAVVRHFSLSTHGRRAWLHLVTIFVILVVHQLHQSDYRTCLHYYRICGSTCSYLFKNIVMHLCIYAMFTVHACSAVSTCNWCIMKVRPNTWTVCMGVARSSSCRWRSWHARPFTQAHTTIFNTSELRNTSNEYWWLDFGSDKSLLNFPWPLCQVWRAKVPGSGEGLAH